MIFHAQNFFSSSHFSFECIFEIGSGDKCPLSQQASNFVGMSTLRYSYVTGSCNSL